MKKLLLVISLFFAASATSRAQNFPITYDFGVSQADRALIERAVRESDAYYRSLFGVGVRPLRVEVFVSNAPNNLWAVTQADLIRLYVGSGQWIQGSQGERYHFVAREMFMAMEQQLAGNRRSAEVWLHDGMGEYMGYKAADWAGVYGFGAAHFDNVERAKNAIRPLNLIQVSDFSYFPLVFLAAESLVNQVGLTGVGEFYARGGDFNAFIEVFRKAVPTFYNEFEALRDELFRPVPTMEFVGRLPPEYKPVQGYIQFAFRLKNHAITLATECECPANAYIGPDNTYSLIFYLPDTAAPGEYSFRWHNVESPLWLTGTVDVLANNANLIPVIFNIARTTATEGESGFDLGINGFAFTLNAFASWDGQPRPTRTGSNGFRQLFMSLTAADLKPGVHQVTVTNIPERNGGTSTPATFTVSIPGSVLAISPGGIVNNAGYGIASTAVAPGSIVALFGSRLTDGTTCLPPACNPTFSELGNLSTSLAGARVLVNSTSVPLFYVSPGQIGFQMPYNVIGNTATVKVSLLTQSSPPSLVAIEDVAPGIFTADASGRGQAAVTHADGSGVTPASPARPGETVILYATGLGRTSPEVLTGQRPAVASRTVAAATVLLDGLPITPDFSGLAGCCVGLNQINFRIPDNARSGAAIPLAIAVGTKQSNPTTIAIQ